MSKIIKDEAELKNMLVSLMVQATKDASSASQTFEDQARYTFNLKSREQDSSLGRFSPQYINDYLLTVRVKACGSSNPISLDKYIEDFHFGDTHSATIDTEKEIITTHNSNTMRCQIFINLKIIETYEVSH